MPSHRPGDACGAQVNPSAQLVQTDDAGKTFSTRALTYQAQFENDRRWLAWDLLFGDVDRTHPLWRYLHSAGATSDELTWFRRQPLSTGDRRPELLPDERPIARRSTRAVPGVSAGGNGRDVYVTSRPCGRAARFRATGHPPRGLAALWTAARNHRGPSRLDSRGADAVDARSLGRGAQCPARRGEVRAVTAWALFGLTDWDSLVTRLDRPLRTWCLESAALSRALPPWRRCSPISPPGDRLHNPCSIRRAGGADRAGCGSSRIPTRIRMGFHRRPWRCVIARVSARRPILMPGAGHSGDGVRADLRVARPWLSSCCRGPNWTSRMRCRWPRPSSDPAVGRRQRRGLVRVDEAELDQERCRRENTTGAQRLAEASWTSRSATAVFLFRPRVRRTLPAPYREGDRSRRCQHTVAARPTRRPRCRRHALTRWSPEPVPSSVHGTRPMPCIGPSRHSLPASRGGQPSDQRVSPTYVPDLVSVALDLLIDGADGVWHLANDGDVSWSELARKAASALGYSDDLVEDCSTEELGLAAARPAYSVLGTDRGQRLPELEDALARFVAERDRHLRRPSRGTAA